MDIRTVMLMIKGVSFVGNILKSEDLKVLDILGFLRKDWGNGKNRFLSLWARASGH